MKIINVDELEKRINKYFEQAICISRLKIKSIIDSLAIEIKTEANDFHEAVEGLLLAEAAVIELKGALRTMAIRMFEIDGGKNKSLYSCKTCEYVDCCGSMINCVPRRIKDAIANPTKEG